MPASSPSDTVAAATLPLTSRHVLVVDDDAFARALIADVLVAQGFEVVVAADGSEGLDLFLRHHPAVVVSDLHMPGMRGLELVRRLRALDPEAAVVLVSGYAELETAVEAMKAGAADFLLKPIEPGRLLEAVSAAQ